MQKTNCPCGAKLTESSLIPIILDEADRQEVQQLDAAAYKGYADSRAATFAQKLNSKGEALDQELFDIWVAMGQDEKSLSKPM